MPACRSAGAKATSPSTCPSATAPSAAPASTPFRLPGDVTEQQLDLIIGDMASLAFKWHKPLSARLLPVAGKDAGDMTEFDDPYLVNATIQPMDH